MLLTPRCSIPGEGPEKPLHNGNSSSAVELAVSSAAILEDMESFGALLTRESYSDDLIFISAIEMRSMNRIVAPRPDQKISSKRHGKRTGDGRLFT